MLYENLLFSAQKSVSDKHFVLTVNVGRCACVFKAAVEIIMFDIYIYFTT